MATQTKKTASARKKQPPAPTKRPIRREVGAIVCLVLSVWLFFGYGKNGGPGVTAPRDFLTWLFGAGFYLVPMALLVCSFTLAFHRGHPVTLRVTCTMLFPLVMAVIIHACGGDGGVITGGIADAISTWIHPAFTVVVFLLLAFVLLFFILSRVIRRILRMYLDRDKREYDPPAPEPELPKFSELPARIEPRPRRRRPKKGEFDIPVDDKPTKERIEPIPQPVVLAPPEDDEPPRRVRPESDIPLDIPFMEDRKRRPESVMEEQVSQKPPRKVSNIPPEPEPIEIPSEPEPEPPPAPPLKVKPVAKTAPSPMVVPPSPPTSGYVFPPVDLLAPGTVGQSADGASEVQVNIERLETAFRSFGVNVNVTQATRGPSVTRYEAELESGVKLSRLTNLSDDIALSLGKTGVRISPMPDKISTVGIEVPNKSVSTVFLRELIEAPAFADASSKLTFAIGKNISGDCIVGNISKLTHVLVAGTTGSGKSVCLNSLILSILYKATPEEVKFIMIDPKMVEFNIFNGIPHLLVPVVTDAKKASGALQWAVVEMEKRYSMFMEYNVRDLEGYNAAMRKKDEPIVPQIVVIIDELADLMMTCGKEVEESIVRVAQKGRAAGVHLVIATQSPRADVITGLMKANLPSRIALKVSSSLESRIILDAGGGAEKLIGNGDMLFAPNGTSKPIRVQGTWVTDAEREEVVNFIKNSGEAQYSEEIMTEIERAAEAKDKNGKPEPTEVSDYDELLPQAAETVFEMQQASTSLLQRRLKLGYARAARIIDQLEEVGVLGPFNGAKPREILITRDQWREMQYMHGTAPIGGGEHEKPYSAQLDYTYEVADEETDDDNADAPPATYFGDVDDGTPTPLRLLDMDEDEETDEDDAPF